MVRPSRISRAFMKRINSVRSSSCACGVTLRVAVAVVVLVMLVQLALLLRSTSTTRDLDAGADSQLLRPPTRQPPVLPAHQALKRMPGISRLLPYPPRYLPPPDPLQPLQDRELERGIRAKEPQPTNHHLHQDAAATRISVADDTTSAPEPRLVARAPAKTRAGEPRHSSVLVLGMHRSSTSVLTEALSEAMNLRIGWESTAHYETMFFVSLSDNVLRELHPNATWSSLPFDVHAVHELRWPSCHAISRRLVLSLLEGTNDTPEQQAAHAGAVLLAKDPRFCVTLPYFLSCLPVPPNIVFIYRNPLEVAQSLHTRDALPLSHGVRLWYQYNLLGLHHSSALNRTFVAADELQRSPHTVLHFLYRVLAHEWRLPNLTEPTAWLQSSAKYATFNATRVHSRAPSDPALIEARLEQILSNDPQVGLLASQVMQLYKTLLQKTNTVE